VPRRDSVVQHWHTPEPIYVPTSATDALYDHGIMDLETSCPPRPLNSGSIPSKRHPFRTTQFESGHPSASFPEMALDFAAIGIPELGGENVHNFFAVDFD
jgi:hypothetical protein